MRRSAAINWKDKLPAESLRYLEYLRLTKEFNAHIPQTLPELLPLVLGGGVNEFKQFSEETAGFTTASAEHYEDVEFTDEFAKRVRTLNLGVPWNDLTPGVKRLPPKSASMMRLFQRLVLQFESDPALRGMVYFWISFVNSVIGELVWRKIEEIMEESKNSDDPIVRATEMMKNAGKLIENLGRSLQGKSTPKGKLDKEKIKVIRFIRDNQKTRLSWNEMHAALKYAGVHFEDAESLRVFASRYAKRRV